MKQLIPTLFILAVACSGRPEKEILSGDLYFSFFRIGSFYNQPDSVAKRFKIFFDTTKYEAADPEERRFLNQYNKLKDEGLLYHPFVDILTEKDSVVTLVLEQNDYGKISKFKRKELQDKKKKVRIVARVRRLGDRLFYCSDLISVDKVDGVTGIKSGKLKIEDYN